MGTRNIYVTKNEIKTGELQDTLIAELNSSICFAIYWYAHNRSIMGHASPEKKEDNESDGNSTDEIGEMIFSMLKKIEIPAERKKELKVYLAYDNNIENTLVAEARDKLAKEELEFIILESFGQSIKKVFFHCIDGATSLEIVPKDTDKED